MSDDGGREARFRAIYLAHYDDIWRYAMRRLPSNDVAGVVSDVFLVAWRRLDEAPQADEVRLWLYAVARNCVANSQRGQRRYSRLLDRLTSTRPRGLTVYEVVDDGPGEVVGVSTALGALAEKDQEVLRLLFWEQLSQQEAAAVLGVSANALAIRAHRARQHLKENLRDQRKMVCDHGHEETMLEVRTDER